MSDLSEARCYGAEGYAATLTHIGSPFPLERSLGCLVARGVPGSEATDLVAPYPLLSPARPAELAADLEALPRGIASVTAVIDPLAGATHAQLERAFPDHLIAFKRHYLRDLSEDPEVGAPKNHRRNLRKALRECEVVEVPLEGEHLARWIELYGGLGRRHGITGDADFPAESFERLAGLPGLMVLAARHRGATVAMHLWLLDETRAWYHLGATDEVGYGLGASHALMVTAMRRAAERGAQRAFLGGGAGAGATGEDDGLARFKRGWANDEAAAYLGGRICDDELYDRLVAARGPLPGRPWFPLYRHPGAN